MLQKIKKSEKRPWGSFKVLESGKDHWLKELFISRGKRLSKQFHYKRTEIWVILSGKVLVELDCGERVMKKGETVVIPKKTKHRVKNIGLNTVKIMEFAFGECLEEDIVRIEDDFGRIS